MAAREEAPAADFSFPVTHDHRLGNCSGKLRITSDTLSYIAGKKECRFTAKQSAYSCRLDGGKLEIKTGGRTYRFRPDGESGKADPRRLREILEYISRLHPEAVR